jgi:uncharacterized membrane protein YfcA
MDHDLLQLGVFVTATFVAAFVVGVSGFAFALIAAAAWLHVLSPLQTATLISIYSMLVQGYGTWKVRHAVDWRRIWPFLIGGAPGVALGAVVQHWANPEHLRAGVGIFLVLYAAYGLLRPEIKTVHAGRPVDVAVGLLSGVLGATTGFAGILIVIWCGMRGWPRDMQRGVFQPVSVAMMGMTALALGFTGSFSSETARLFVLGLPALALGTWIGFRLYGRLDEAAFRKIVLILLLASGVPLIATLR